MDSRTPVIVGVGQVTQRPGEDHPREPLELMAEAARRAQQDAGSGGILSEIESVRVINIMSWPSIDPPSDLARALGSSPRDLQYTHIGGNTPQWLVNETASAIARGELRGTLIAGAEAVYSARRARASGADPGWSPRGNPTPNVGDPRAGISDIEAKHGATLPTRVYPLFENALRAHYGRTIEEHQAVLGDLMARFSQTAAGNEHAWFREAKTAGDIATVRPDNRYIGFPYPKYMNSIIDVDQGAALIMTNTADARRLGVPEDRWVYLHGCGDATDHWYFTERANYYTSPAIRACGRRALSMAGLAIDDIAHFDLYSCFPSAVQITRDMLDIAPDDARPLTVTGGLPYFGGPGNNYVTHSIATMVERLRADRGAYGMVTGNGWYVTKHSAGIYSTTPAQESWNRTDPKIDQAAIDAESHPVLVPNPSGNAAVETYTVIFDREGAPELGIVIGRLADGSRFIANTPGDRELLESMTLHEVAGTSGRVAVAEDGRNVFTPA